MHGITNNEVMSPVQRLQR